MPLLPGDTVACLRLADDSRRFPFRPLAPGLFLIGSGPSCDLRLGEAGIPAIHSVIDVSKEAAKIFRIARQPELVINGEAVDSAKLHGGDLIEVGVFRAAWQPVQESFTVVSADDIEPSFSSLAVEELLAKLEDDMALVESIPADRSKLRELLEAAQKAVEAQNFASRKHVLEYDDVMNKQRGAVYTMRRNLLEGTDQKERIYEMARGIIATVVTERIPEKSRPDEWDISGLESDILTRFGAQLRLNDLRGSNLDLVEDTIFEQIQRKYEDKEALIGAEYMREAERVIMLNVIDNQWKDHLLSMDHLKEGIGLRGYGQKDPLLEYKKESYTLFQDMMNRIEDETVRYLYFLRFEANAGSVPFQVDEDGNEMLIEAEPEVADISAEAAEEQRRAEAARCAQIRRAIVARRRTRRQTQARPQCDPGQRAAPAALRPDDGELRTRRYPPVAGRIGCLFGQGPRGDRAFQRHKSTRSCHRRVRTRRRRQARDAHGPLGSRQSRSLHRGDRVVAHRKGNRIETPGRGRGVAL